MLGLKWKLPKEMYGPLRSFTVTCTVNKFKTMSSTVDPVPCDAWPNMYCVTFGALQPETEHFITVTARNTEVDEDGEPALVQAVTIESSPEPPPSLQVISQTQNSLTIEWRIPDLLNGRLKSFLIAIQQTDSSDPTNCCVDYNVYEMKVDKEQALYVYQKKDLRSASAYSISVSAKTVLIGSGRSVIGYTEPPVPYMDGNIQILGNTHSMSTTPTVKLFSPTENAELIRGYLLLVLPKLPADDFMGSTVWNEWLKEEIMNNTNADYFYIARELQQADLEKNPEVTVGTGSEEELGIWGEVRDPILQNGEDYRIGLIIILEYCGVHSVGFTETMSFTIQK